MKRIRAPRALEIIGNKKGLAWTHSIGSEKYENSLNTSLRRTRDNTSICLPIDMVTEWTKLKIRLITSKQRTSVNTCAIITRCFVGISLSRNPGTNPLMFNSTAKTPKMKLNARIVPSMEMFFEDSKSFSSLSIRRLMESISLNTGFINLPGLNYANYIVYNNNTRGDTFYL